MCTSCHPSSVNCHLLLIRVAEDAGAFPSVRAAQIPPEHVTCPQTKTVQQALESNTKKYAFSIILESPVSGDSNPGDLDRNMLVKQSHALGPQTS